MIYKIVLTKSHFFLIKKCVFDHCSPQLRSLEIYYLLPFLSNSHMFTRVGSNPSMNKVMKQESDQEESQ